MKWNKYTILTLSSAEDVVTGALAEQEIYSVEIEDSVPLTPLEKEQMFVDILPEKEDDGVARISFYLEEDDDCETIVAGVKAALAELKQFGEIGECTITTSETEDQDWINNWKQFFKQFYLDDILFVPSWEEVPAEAKDKLVIHIDPGTAFGTGMHETTQLCIRELRKYVNEDTKLLDVGTGSGVLSLLAFKFGAKSAMTTDLDPCAVEATADNLAKNDLSDADFTLIIGNIIDDREVQDKVGYECYDIVVANILADVLLPLTPVVVHQMKPGGMYITSGIIEGKELLVADAMKKAGLTVVSITEQGEWRCVVGKKEA